MKGTALTLILLFLLLIITGCDLFQFGAGDEDHNTMLEELGVDTDLGERSDPNQNPLPDNYNPIGPKVGVLFKQCEIYAAGVSAKGHYQTLFGDETENYKVLFQEPETQQDWATGNPKKGVAADVDGDGLDEVVISVYYLNSEELALRIVDYDGSTATEVKRVFVPGLEDMFEGSPGRTYLGQDITSGDYDGDGKAEIALTVGGRFMVFDDYDTDFASLAEPQITDPDPDSETFLRVTSGDYDIDGKDEILVAVGSGNAGLMGEYIIYDDLIDHPQMTEPISSGKIQTDADAESVYLFCADVAAGDFDGDGLPETAFSGRKEEMGHMLLVLDTTMGPDSKPVFEFLESAGNDNYETGPQHYLTGVDSGDIDGDGKDEIATYQDIYVVKSGKIDYHEIHGNEALIMGANYGDNYPLLDTMCVGDVTGDKKDDVLFVTADSDQIYIFSTASDGTLKLNEDFDVDPSPTDVILCLPNVDHDSAVLEYREKELLFTDPIIAAVLASPPYFRKINGDAVGGTGFGSIEGQSTETGTSHGFHVGFTVGVGFDAPFGLGEAEVKTTVENSFNWGTATTHEVTETWGYTTPVGEDKIIFTAIPFDVYYYDVLSSPDESQIGKTVTVNVPRKPGKFHQVSDFFNEHSGGITLDETVLTHEKGDPFSYADESERDTLQAASGNRGLFSRHSLEVGTGTGTGVISLEDVETETSTFDYTLDVTVEAETQVGTVIAGASAGYQFGYSYSTSVSQGTYIEGEVPDIPQDDFNSERRFWWGLMAYPVLHLGQEFTMVTYWVDN
ncbi:MAG: hypothetical protein ACLFSE_08645 [Spirochaetia bacterium]